MTLRLLHTADWHLGASFSSFGEAAEQRRDDQERAIKRIVKLAVENEVAALIISGDLFDSTRPDPRATNLAREVFDELAAEGIPAFNVPGTHDHLGISGGVVCWEHENLVWFDQVECAEPQEVETDNNVLWLYGLTAPSGHRADLSSLKRSDRLGVHVGMLHASIIGGEGMSVAYKDLPVRPVELARLGLDYIALGHYHRHQIIRHEGEIVGAYSGSPEGLRFEETGPRVALLVELDVEGVEVTPLEIGAGLCFDLRIDVADATDDQAILRKLEAYAGTNHYARVRLTGLIDEPLDVEALHRQTAKHFAHLVLIDETDASAGQRIRDLSAEPTVRGQSIRQLLLNLNDTDDPHEKRILKRALVLLVATFDRHTTGASR